MSERRLRIAVLVVRKTREQMQALFGAGGGDIQEARGLGVLGVGVEVLEVLVGEVLVSAGLADGGKKQTPRTPLVRGANNFLPEEERWVAAAGAAVDDRGGEDAREALEEEIVLDQLPDGGVAAGASNVVELMK